ncbi:MAG TPA: hypothetical protein VFS67_30705 [Polyangiaceae bacterium]|nr:hypothetical protein [Polyangiaceae bacterium]
MTEPPPPGPDPVPSVLPAEGVDLLAELERYRMWFIEQALIRAGGDVVAAGKLLGFRHKSTLYRLLRHRQNGGSFRPGRATHRESAAPERAIEPPAPPPEPAPPAAAVVPPLSEAEQRLERTCRRIPWGYVEQLRAQGWAEWRIARNVASGHDLNRVLVERALRRRTELQAQAAESSP